MQAEISTGTDCLRFLGVTGGNLSAPAGNSIEVFIDRVRADFFKTRDVSFYSVPNTLTKVTVCCLWSQSWTLQIWFCSKNVEVFLAGSSNRYPKKQLAEKVFTTIKMIGNWLLSLKSKEETTLKWILSGYIKKTKSNLNLKIGEEKAQVLQCLFSHWNLQELLNFSSFLTTSNFFNFQFEGYSGLFFKKACFF